MITFGKNIVILRQAMGWSQLEKTMLQVLKNNLRRIVKVWQTKLKT